MPDLETVLNGDMCTGEQSAVWHCGRFIERTGSPSYGKQTRLKGI